MPAAITAMPSLWITSASYRTQRRPGSVAHPSPWCETDRVMSRTARPERGHPDLAGREAHPQRTPSAPPVLAAGNQAVARMLARFGVSEAVGGLVSGVETLTQMATGAIGGSVGHKGKNDPVDVAIVRGLLNAAGFDDPETGAAIERYQREKLGWPSADGRVDPGGKTLRALHGQHGAPASGGATPAPSTPAEPAPTPAPSPAPAPAPTGGDGGVLSWPGLLPQVKRDAKHAITVKKGKLELNVPAVDTPALTDDQKAIVDQIRANREALPSLLSDKNMG